MIAVLLAAALAAAAPANSTAALADSAGRDTTATASTADSIAVRTDSTAVRPDSIAALVLAPAGGFTVSGPGGATEPVGLALDGFDRPFVTDLALRRLLRFDRDGKWLGETGSLGDDAGRLRRPGAVVPAGALQIAVLDEENRTVLGYDLFGRFQQVLVDLDTGAPSAGGRVVPVALASDKSGALYVGDANQDRVLVFDLDGSLARVLTGYAPGSGTIRGVAGLAVGRRGDIAVSERGSRRIVRLDPTGAPVTSWTLPGLPGKVAEPRLPLAVDDSLRIAVAEPAAGRVSLYDRGGRLLAQRDGLAGPAALCFARDGSLWVAERRAGRLSRFVVGAPGAPVPVKGRGGAAR